MGQVQKFAKISVRRMENQMEYATEKYIYDSLQVFEAKYSLPVRDAIAYLRQGRADSISLNKEKPYANFHATRLKERILVSLREASKDLDLELPISSSIDLVEDMH